MGYEPAATDVRIFTLEMHTAATLAKSIEIRLLENVLIDTFIIVSSADLLHVTSVWIASETGMDTGTLLVCNPTAWSA